MLVLDGAAAAAETPVPAEVAVRHATLRAEIDRHDEQYFRRAAPAISDASYDVLRRELAALERAHPGLADGAAPAWGDDRSGLFRTGRHLVPMAGLAKASTEAEVRAFVAVAQAGPAGFVIEPKVDGVAVSLTYERGRLVRALTRGDGAEGDDITALLRGLDGLEAAWVAGPPAPTRVELRGELYVSPTAWARVNREREAAGEPVLANPRGAAAGALRQSDPAELGRRGVALVVHGFGAWEPAADRPAGQREFQARLRAWGLPALTAVRAAGEADAVWRAVQAMGRERTTGAYPTDGVVIKVDAVARQRELGIGAEGPRWALAFKFTPPRAETRLRAIEVQVGRTGLLTPVAVLDPVELAGAVVTRATLHNADEIARRDLRIGDRVVVEKAGEVIPAVVEPVLARRAAGVRPYEFPRTCPGCGTAVEHRADEAARRCPNRECRAQLAARIAHLASREVLDLPGLGPALIEALIARDRVRTIADVFRLQAEDLVLPGRQVGGAAATLARAIAAARGAELRRWIAALSIPGVGAVAAEKLADAFPDLGQLAAADEPALRAAGIGLGTARAVVDYFAYPGHRVLVRELGALTAH